MISKGLIETLIEELEVLYDAPIDPEHKKFYSKLALMELCGWLESSMDQIVEGYSANELFESENQEHFRTNVIGKTYGFDYKIHLRPMLIYLIGLKGMEELEANLKAQGDFQILTSELSTLWGMRRRAAHTTIVGVTPTYQSPSTIKNHLITLYPLLTTLEVELTKL